MLSSLFSISTTVFLVVLFIVVVEVILYLILHRGLHLKTAFPYILISPAVIGISLLILYPITYNFILAFSNMSISKLTVERGLVFGFEHFFSNIARIFTAPVLKQQYFFSILLRTMLWTAIQVTFHVTCGYCIAVLLNRPMRMRGVYRALLLFPWAIPQVIAVLSFRGEFNYEYGYINTVLGYFNIEKIRWLTDGLWNFIAINITNIWLGVPFMAIILLGGLQSIDQTYYDAAEIDGASKPQRFSNITLPLLKPVMIPAIILGIVWTFNNFNVPFLLNQNELETSDILVTALFRAAFLEFRFGFAAALALIVFFILLGLSLVMLAVTKPDIQFQSKRKRLKEGE